MDKHETESAAHHIAKALKTAPRRWRVGRLITARGPVHTQRITVTNLFETLYTPRMMPENTTGAAEIRCRQLLIQD